MVGPNTHPPIPFDGLRTVNADTSAGPVTIGGV